MDVSCKVYCRQTSTCSANTLSNSKATCLHSLASCLRKQFLWRRSIYCFGLWDMKMATQHLVSLLCVGKVGSYRHCSWPPQHCKNSFPGKTDTHRLAMWRGKTVLSPNIGVCAQPLSVKHHSMVHIQVKNIRGEMGWYVHQRGDNVVGSVSGELVGGEGLQWHDKRYTWHSQNPQTALSTCGLITSMIFLVMLCCRCMNNISPVDNITCQLYTCFITTRTLFFKKLLVVGFDFFFFFSSKACFPILFLFQAHGS